jgi:CrcB protein
MLYLWVAAGSAIGGVARFWLSLAMTRLTGPQFPWGTILINVLGSFIIGLFATLTAGGRYGAPIEIRTFVMVGICGGFTTFSSFSLQTLDLLRAQPMQAFGNVALSVLCCLAAVAAGSYAGLALNRPA